MALIYRTVPSFEETKKLFGKINKEQQNLEGILYDLGFISFENGYPFFRQNGESSINTFQLKDKRHKFFFFFPYDALMCTFGNIESRCYNQYKWELLEYAIPDEFLLEYCGYGFYRGSAHVEFSIPENIFQENSHDSINIEMLKKQLGEYRILLTHENGIYKSEFVTGKRVICSPEELYNDRDMLSFQETTELLQQKGIASNKEDYEIYELLKENADNVFNNKEREIRKLQENLKRVLINKNI